MKGLTFPFSAGQRSRLPLAQIPHPMRMRACGFNPFLQLALM
jgi:hypothetical protein